MITHGTVAIVVPSALTPTLALPNPRASSVTRRAGPPGNGAIQNWYGPSGRSLRGEQDAVAGEPLRAAHLHPRLLADRVELAGGGVDHDRPLVSDGGLTSPVRLKSTFRRATRPRPARREAFPLLTRDQLPLIAAAGVGDHQCGSPLIRDVAQEGDALAVRRDADRAVDVRQNLTSARRRTPEP